MTNQVVRSWGERMRNRIEASKIMDKLISYAEASVEEAPLLMTPHQCTVGLALLKKSLPDLHNTQIVEAPIDWREPRHLTRVEILRRLEDLEQASGPERSTSH